MKINKIKNLILIIIYYFKKLCKYYYIFLFLISYIFYCLSLEKCYEGFDTCSLKTEWIKIKIEQEIISCIIIVLLLELILYKIISPFNILHLIIFYICSFIYSHGIDFDDHGYFNFIFGIALNLILLIIIFPLNILIYIIRKRNKKYIIIFIVSILIIVQSYLFLSDYYTNCNDWKYGLNNTILENDINKHGCIIQTPNSCPYKIGKYFFDRAQNKRDICYENTNTKKRLIKYAKNKYINENSKRIGYPLTYQDLEIHNGLPNNSDRVKNLIYNNLVDLDNISLTQIVYKNKTPEVYIDYNKYTSGELIINLNYNKTLSLERKIFENNSTPYSDNIIIIFVDSVSRVYSMRSLKKTLKFFEKFISYKGAHNSDFPSENFHSFQFFKYHSFNYYTRYNYPQLFYGRVNGKFERNIKFLKENGYITCFINDMCYKEPTNNGHNLTLEEISDHEFLICDPNTKSPFSSKPRCLYNKLNCHHALEYGNQFWRKYKENRKFLSINLEDGHEGTLEVLKYSDDIIYNFLNNLYKDNLFKSTAIFLLSDHGTVSPSIYHLNNFYRIEKFLPMFYFFCNDRKNITYNEQYENIIKNQQILITGYDIYNTISHLVFGDKYNTMINKTEEKETQKSPNGISLFNKINSKLRSPKYYVNMTNKICQ